MAIRILDIVVSILALLVAAPVLLPVMFLVWWTDRHSPFYVANRVGLHGELFKIIKLRSMVVGADRSGVDSTSATDNRITPVGQIIRRYKLDELPQFWNVLTGSMSVVGPRPNVKREVDLYSEVERGLLTVRPGITDFASIVFADEGEILRGHANPDLAYNQLIRPYKSRLGLVYVQYASPRVMLALIALTILSILSRKTALHYVSTMVRALTGDEVLARVARRISPLEPVPPPGMDEVVKSR